MLTKFRMNILALYPVFQPRLWLAAIRVTTSV